MRMVPAQDSALRQLILELYLHSADEDYLAARLNAKHGLAQSFAWCSQQSIEKVLKCALLLNGEPTAAYGHKISEAFHAAKTKLTYNFPKKFESLDYLDLDEGDCIHAKESVAEFLKRTEHSGSAHNRYRHSGLRVEIFDLIKLDECFFHFRRSCVCLDSKVPNTDKPFSQFLSEEPNWDPNGELNSIKRSPPPQRCKLTDVLHWNNLFFYASARPREITQRWLSVRSSPIENTIRFRDLPKTSVEWLFKNAYFSKSDKHEIEALLKQTKK